MADNWRTSVQVYNNVPIDVHNYPFTEIEVALTAWMNNYAGNSYSNLQFVRTANNYSVHVPDNAEVFGTSNFLSWINQDYGNRRFYGRIVEREYVNSGSTRLHFVVDPLLTWMDVLQFGQSYVERETIGPSDDQPKQHTFPENLETDDLICASEQYLTPNIRRIRIYATNETDGQNVNGQMIDGVYTGASIYEANDSQGANAILSAFANSGKIESVIGVQQVPEFLSSDMIAQLPTSLGGYTPRNQKLFTYPYCFVEVSNNQGVSKYYRFENSNMIGSIRFGSQSTVSVMPSVIMYPTQYKGITNHYDEGVTIDDFPVCAWSGDYFANWQSQNVARNIGSAALVAGGIIMGGPALGAAAIAGLNLVSSIQKASATPNMGSTGSGPYMNVKINRDGFTMRIWTLKGTAAKKIDDYFTRYGYAINNLKTVQPMRHGRTYHFFKTNGLTLCGGIPYDYKQEIERMFNDGITLWATNGTFGNYGV